MWTPFENLRRFFISSPPWILFILSLGIMAIGVVALAYHLNIDDKYKNQENKPTRFCWTNVKRKISSQKKFSTHSAATGTANVSLSVQITVHRDFVNKLNLSQSTVYGSLYNGQLGLRNNIVNETWSFELMPGLNSSVCVDESCKFLTIHSCLIVRAEERNLLPLGWDGNNGCQNFSTDHFSKTIESKEFIIVNERDFDQIGSSDASTVSKQNNWCNKGYILTLQNEDVQDYVVFPMVHDTVIARLHLLYTSYFLMITVVTILCYAMCRRASYRYRHHQEKETFTGDDSQQARYGRLREF